jgi:hypothetical protein
MAARAGKRWWWLVTLVVLALLVTGGIVGFQVAVGHLQGRVVEALGPTSEIESRTCCISVQFGGSSGPCVRGSMATDRPI